MEIKEICYAKKNLKYSGILLEGQLRNVINPISGYIHGGGSRMLSSIIITFYENSLYSLIEDLVLISFRFYLKLRQLILKTLGF